MWGMKKKQKLFAVSNGTIIPITQVKDEVFAQKMLGEGYGIIPSDDAVFAPISGIITSIFPTKHAISIISKFGLEVIVHLGIDTVELKGKPFNIKVKVGAKVNKTTQLAAMNRQMIIQKQKDPTIVIAFTNMKILTKIPEITKASVKHGQFIGNLFYR